MFSKDSSKVKVKIKKEEDIASDHNGSTSEKEEKVIQTGSCQARNRPQGAGRAPGAGPLQTEAALRGVLKPPSTSGNRGDETKMQSKAKKWQHNSNKRAPRTANKRKLRRKAWCKYGTAPGLARCDYRGLERGLGTRCPELHRQTPTTPHPVTESKGGRAGYSLSV